MLTNLIILEQTNPMSGTQTLVDMFGPLGALTLIIAYLIYQIIQTKKEHAATFEIIQFKDYILSKYEEDDKIHKEILQYLKIVSEKYAEEVNDTQIKIVVESIFHNSQTAIYNYINSILKNNHIQGNEREVKAKIKTFVANRYQKDVLMLKEFKYHNKTLDTFLEVEWKDYIIEVTLEIVFQEKGEKTLNSTLKNAFESFTYNMLAKVL